MGIDGAQAMLTEWKTKTCENYEFGHWMQALIFRKRGQI